MYFCVWIDVLASLVAYCVSDNALRQDSRINTIRIRYSPKIKVTRICTMMQHHVQRNYSSSHVRIGCPHMVEMAFFSPHIPLKSLYKQNSSRLIYKKPIMTIENRSDQEIVSVRLIQMLKNASIHI